MANFSFNLGKVALEKNRLINKNKNFDNDERILKFPEEKCHCVVRILPPKSADDELFFVNRAHRINEKMIDCPLTMDKDGRWIGKCPVCDQYRKYWKEITSTTGNYAEQLKTKARGIKPIESFYYNVILKSASWSGPNGEVLKDLGPYILRIGKQLQMKIIYAITGNEELDEPELGDITDFANGRDFKIIKNKKGSGVESFPDYTESKFLNPSKSGTQEQIDKWMSSLHDLSSVKRLTSLEDLEKAVRIHMGIDTDSDTSVQMPQTMKAPVVTSTTVDDDDDAMVDKEFFEKLKGM